MKNIIIFSNSCMRCLENIVICLDNIMILAVAHFPLFSEAPGSHKTLEMRVRMEPRAPKITKSLEKRALKKTLKINTAKSDN